MLPTYLFHHRFNYGPRNYYKPLVAFCSEILEEPSAFAQIFSQYSTCTSSKMSSHILLSATLFRGLWFGKDLILDAFPDKTLPFIQACNRYWEYTDLRSPCGWLILTAKILYLNWAWQLKVKYCWYVCCKSCDYKAKQWKWSCPMPLTHLCQEESGWIPTFLIFGLK